MWEKRTLWENSARVPMIMKVPWLPQSQGTRSAALVELVDVYKSVHELLGVPLPADETHQIEGDSLVPLLKSGGQHDGWKTAALTTYPRCPVADKPVWDNSCIHSTERTEFEFMGYSMHVDHTDGNSYRFTDWYRWNGTSLSPLLNSIRATELYNHSTTYRTPVTDFDGFEVSNLASTHTELVAVLRSKLHHEFALSNRIDQQVVVADSD